MIIGHLKFNPQINSLAYQQLEHLALYGEFPHLLISGAPGSGKMTLAQFFVRMVNQLPPNSLEFKRSTWQCKHISKTLTVNILYSHNCMLINPSIHGVYDRIILREFIKQTVSRVPVAGQVRLVIIREAHLLTKEAQQALRRAIEQYSRYTRFIFLIDSCQYSNIIPALISRLVHIKARTCSDNLIKQIISEQYQLSSQELTSLLEEARGNLKSIVSQAQMLTIVNKRFSIELSIKNLADYLWTSRPSIGVIKEANKYIQKLLHHNVHPRHIMSSLIVNWIDHITDSQLAWHVISQSLEFLHGLTDNNKPSFHLEGLCIFIVKLKKTD